MAERLRAQDVFEFLRPEQIHVISEAADKVRFAAGDTVYEKGAKADHFFVVLKGQIALRLPGKGGVNILIDNLTQGAIFGSSVRFYKDSYSLTAQCTENAELLKLRYSILKELMDQDPRMGYALQTRISEIYFSRYLETMKKLQAIVMNIPIEPD